MGEGEAFLVIFVPTMVIGLVGGWWWDRHKRPASGKLAAPREPIRSPAVEALLVALVLGLAVVVIGSALHLV